MANACAFLVRHFLLWRVPDYLMIIILAIIAAIIGAKVRPHCRDFEWTDPSINHPFATKETFPMYSVIIAVILVALAYFAGELATKWRRPVGKLNMCLHVNGWIVTHAYSILLAFVFVNVSKLYAGRLRPDFIARLAREGITQANVASFTHSQLCHAARNGRLSFPSGHSGTAFAGFVPPCLYLMGLMRTLKGGRVWLATIALLPLILPVAIAISRTVDYRHNFDDILTGSICGALCGIFAVLVSFRPSMRGEWTLRDYPDDRGLTRVWMQGLLGGGRGRHGSRAAAEEGSRTASDSEDSDGSEEAAVEIAMPRSVASRSHESSQYVAPHGKTVASPSPSMENTSYLSPAVHQERAANPSPSTKHNAHAPRPASGKHRSKPHRELQETPDETSSSGRRKSTGEPAVVERFYPRE